MRIVLNHPLTDHDGHITRAALVHALAAVRQRIVEREKIGPESSMLMPMVGLAEILVALTKEFGLSDLEALCAFGPHLAEELLFAGLFRIHGDGLANLDVDRTEARFDLEAVKPPWFTEERHDT